MSSLDVMAHAGSCSQLQSNQSSNLWSSMSRYSQVLGQTRGMLVAFTTRLTLEIAGLLVTLDQMGALAGAAVSVLALPGCHVLIIGVVLDDVLIRQVSRARRTEVTVHARSRVHGMGFSLFRNAPAVGGAAVFSQSSSNGSLGRGGRCSSVDAFAAVDAVGGIAGRQRYRV
jgi:hypothetical protein